MMPSCAIFCMKYYDKFIKKCTRYSNFRSELSSSGFTQWHANLAALLGNSAKQPWQIWQNEYIVIWSQQNNAQQTLCITYEVYCTGLWWDIHVYRHAWLSLQTKSCNDVTFSVTGGTESYHGHGCVDTGITDIRELLWCQFYYYWRTVGFHNDNIRFHQWQRWWYHGKA